MSGAKVEAQRPQYRFLSLAADRPVYLHRFGGVGRTGTAVCWLLRHDWASPRDVIELLGDLRQAEQQTQGRRAPETGEQIALIEGWRGADR